MGLYSDYRQQIAGVIEGGKAVTLPFKSFWPFLQQNRQKPVEYVTAFLPIPTADLQNATVYKKHHTLFFQQLKAKKKFDSNLIRKPIAPK